MTASVEQPRHPELVVSTQSDKSLALVAAVRQALRGKGVEREEIREFSDQALSHPDDQHRLSVCRSWVSVDPLAES